MLSQLAIGNWKMNPLTRQEAIELATGVARGVRQWGSWDPSQVGIGLGAPYLFLEAVGVAIAGTGIELVAQDAHPEPSGARTSAISAAMLASVGVDRVIVGHSERRTLFHDDDAIVAAKLRAVLREPSLSAVLCVGESLEERQSSAHEGVVERQLRAALEGVSAADLPRTVVAYEPVWAVGTGHTASPEQAGEMHTFIQGILSTLVPGPNSPLVLYGGSVTPENVNALAATPGIDGVLVGGASLKADSFVRIVKGCATQASDARSS